MEHVALQSNKTCRDEPRPVFLVTIDTEGDNLWARSPVTTTRNAAFLPRFQALCEKYRLRPTYFVDYDMARSRAFQEFGQDVLARGAGEIGMHLHAWNTPPLSPLTDDDPLHHPYLIEYPVALMRQKIAVMTQLLEDTFGTKMRSHRAARWAINTTYARLLVEAGYQADCSVTPHVSWRKTPGAPGGTGGPDYRGFPDHAYFVDPNDISRPGASPLLEIPMTIRSRRPDVLRALPLSLTDGRLTRAALNRMFPWVWLRPNGRNLRALLRIVRAPIQDGTPHVQFMLHSSELMPGGSPHFRSDTQIQHLYDDLEQVFAAASATCAPTTVTEYQASEVAPRPN